MTDTASDVAIVTGATGGMGRAIAALLAKNGRPLILTDRDPEALDDLAETIRDAAQIITVAGDITSADCRAALVAALGGAEIGLLAHAAGVSPSMASGQRIFAINFNAAQALVEALLPHMALGGVAVLIASNSAQMIARPIVDRAAKRLIKGQGSLLGRLMLRNPRTAYPLSKRAVQIYAETMAPAFGAMGARIVSLSPGIIDTDMARLEQKAGPEMSRLIRASALGRSGNADEIAGVVSFLGSPAASYISGTDILVDGGTIAGVNAAGGPMKLR